MISEDISMIDEIDFDNGRTTSEYGEAWERIKDFCKKEIPKSVFVVVSIQYDETSLEGVYSTKEKADEMSKLSGGCYISKRELDVYPEHPEGCYLFQVEMDKSGQVKELITGTTEIWTTQDVEPASYYDKVDTAYFRIWAKDNDHAIELANQKRIKIIEENKWFDDYDLWIQDGDDEKAI